MESIFASSTSSLYYEGHPCYCSYENENLTMECCCARPVSSPEEVICDQCKSGIHDLGPRMK